ncbi:hypothetical protein D3C85_1833490 [compost metagenome]
MPPLTVPPTDAGDTVTVAVLFVDILETQTPDVNDVIVMSLVPRVVKPPAVKVPVPAVVIVIGAVKAVPAGLLRL